MNAQEARCKKHSQKSKSRLLQCMEFLHHRKICTEKQKSGRQIKSSQEFFCTKYFFQLKDFPKIKSAKRKVQWRKQCSRILQKTVSSVPNVCTAKSFHCNLIKKNAKVIMPIYKKSFSFRLANKTKRAAAVTSITQKNIMCTNENRSVCSKNCSSEKNRNVHEVESEFLILKYSIRQKNDLREFQEKLSWILLIFVN